MAIEYYKIPNILAGALFTVVSDDSLYSSITNAASAQNLFPWHDVQCISVIPDGYTYDQNVYNYVANTIGISMMVGTLTRPASGNINYDYNITNTKLVRVNVTRGGAVSSRFVNNGVQSSEPNNALPVGVWYTSGSIANQLLISVLLTNSNKTAAKYVTYYRQSLGSGRYRDNFYVGTISYFDVSSFFDGLKPVFIPSPDPYEESGGGEGALPGDETVGLPTEPTLTPIDAGLFSLYSPTVSQMKALADFLWTDFGGTGATVEQVLGEVVEALKRSVSNPLNSMLGLSIIASQGLNKGSDSSVHVGFWDTGVSMTRLTKQYFTVDCGSVTIQPVCGDTFLDYAPYSKFSIFLPYVGMRILDANDVVGHAISVKYRGDAVSGALICFIQRDGQIIAEHAGNCALNLPLTADSWAETISGVGRMISGATAGGLSGGGEGAARGAIRGAASVATNPSAFSPQVSHVGNVAGSAGHMGSQKPFILREAVRFHSTEGFNSIIGYPSYYYRKLGDCHGYTQCLDVHLNHTPATGDELKEIEDLLKQGVII